MNLKQARDTARAWLELAHQGKHPAELAQRAARPRRPSRRRPSAPPWRSSSCKEGEQAAQGRRRRARDPQGADAALWPSCRPALLTRKMVSQDGGPDRRPRSVYQAHHVLRSYAEFSPTGALREQDLERDDFGIAANPRATGLSSKDMIEGIKAPRKRVLNDEEIRAVWKAAVRWATPWAPSSGCCCSPAAARPRSPSASWAEFELANKGTLDHPELSGSRVRYDAPRAAQQRCARQLIERSPAGSEGDYVFSAPRDGTQGDQRLRPSPRSSSTAGRRGARA